MDYFNDGPQSAPCDSHWWASDCYPWIDRIRAGREGNPVDRETSIAGPLADIRSSPQGSSGAIDLDNQYVPTTNASTERSSEGSTSARVVKPSRSAWQQDLKPLVHRLFKEERLTIEATARQLGRQTGYEIT